MEIFNNLNRLTDVDITKYIKTVTQKIQGGSNVKIVSNNNYDMENRKLVNVAEGTENNHAITKQQLETALNDKHDNNQDIDLELKYNFIQSKPQTYQELSANRNNVSSYENVREIFVSIKESFPMETHLDMGNNFINNVKEPTSDDQATNKKYVSENFLKKISPNVIGDLDMNTGKITNLGKPTSNTDATNEKYIDDELVNYLKKDGSIALTGNLNMNSKQIKNVANPTSSNDAINNGYLSTRLNSYVDVGGLTRMTGNLNMDSNKIVNPKELVNDADAANKQLIEDLFHKAVMKPSHDLKYRFEYLKKRVGEWTNEYNIGGGSFINLKESPHFYNKKVLPLTPVKCSK